MTKMNPTMTRTPPETPEPVAFDAVYRRMSPAVLGYLKAQGVDDPEAVTHDVFLAALPRFGSLHGGESGMRTLLFSIAHARSVDHHRQRARTPNLVEYTTEQDRRLSASAEEHVVGRLAERNALSILAVLSDEQRQVLSLRVIADLPLEQVAGIMQKSVGAVKQLQRRALAALKGHPAVELWRSQ